VKNRQHTYYDRATTESFTVVVISFI